MEQTVLKLTPVFWCKDGNWYCASCGAIWPTEGLETMGVLPGYAQSRYLPPGAAVTLTCMCGTQVPTSKLFCCGFGGGSYLCLVHPDNGATVLRDPSRMHVLKHVTAVFEPG